ncbi:methylenetetrahydrofolate reductase-like [Teleopsis dalmanni]|uniref:methylenetetrahydrofolate reductase-like n=1 Tax=Teleopsis dalmanni TaxID=139649 RepID=UPI0018CD4FD0|nr:methylenetetrahydrofolate reductase-like [Teleopsis dalmanni]
MFGFTLCQGLTDNISIGVGGYPEGHPDCPTIEEDIQHLKEKVNAGADFIITQLCFSAETIINFIKNCRENDINVPIIVGIYSPENYRTLIRLMEITKVTMSSEQLAEYRQHRHNPTKFQEFAVQKTLEMITEIFDSDIGVYGLQFFSLNKFNNIKAILQEMNALENRIE